MTKAPSAGTKRARTLRKNATDAEKRLWKHLRNRMLDGIKFRRQHPVPPYTLDFFCEEYMLAIELDGGQHNMPESLERDEEHTAFLEEQGIRVIRFWNNDVLDNTEGVLETVLREIKKPSPTAAKVFPAEKPSLVALSREERGEILIGEIIAAHGIHGLVKVRCFADDPALLEQSSPRLTLKNPMKDHWLAEVEGITDRNGAETLRGTELYIPRSALPDPEEGEYYHADLVNMKALDTEGVEIGTVIDVVNFGASDLLDIKPPSGSSFYLPFTDDTVPEIRKDSIIVSIPKGLLEE